MSSEPPKKPVSLPVVWREARDLIWLHRRRLSLGLVLLLINRLSGLVLPATSKYLIDDVVGKHRGDLLVTLAAAAGGATVIQAATSFALSQVLGVAAQRAITNMRRDVQAHVLRLPVTYFDSTKSGVLISRIMTDAEGIRNLVGTGLVQLVGGFVTAGIALGVLFYLNWRLTTLTLVILAGVRRRHGRRLQAPAAAVPGARQDQRRRDRTPRREPRAASASSSPTSPRSARRSSSRRARTGCSGTWRSRSRACRPSPRSRR